MKTQLKFLALAIAAFNLAQASDQGDDLGLQNAARSPNMSFPQEAQRQGEGANQLETVAPPSRSYFASFWSMVPNSFSAVKNAPSNLYSSLSSVGNGAYGYAKAAAAATYGYAVAAQEYTKAVYGYPVAAYNAAYNRLRGKSVSAVKENVDVEGATKKAPAKREQSEANYEEMLSVEQEKAMLVEQEKATAEAERVKREQAQADAEAEAERARISEKEEKLAARKRAKQEKAEANAARKKAAVKEAIRREEDRKAQAEKKGITPTISVAERFAAAKKEMLRTLIRD